MAEAGLGPILVVDDVAFMRHLLTRLIKGLGYEVVEAASAEEGMRAVQQRTPSLIFLDVVMPDMDGIAMCEWLRAQDATRKTPIVICTARQDRKIVQGAIHAGATDLLLKPVDKQKVNARIRKHIHGEEPEAQDS